MIWFHKLAHPGEGLALKASSSWHILAATDHKAHDGPTVYPACDCVIVDGGPYSPNVLWELRREVVLEEPTQIRPGYSIATPKRGKICSRCLRWTAKMP